MIPEENTTPDSRPMSPRRKLHERVAHRLQDWRVGRLVYQVIVDRFAPSRRLEEKRALYAPPRRLLSWNETPSRGEFLAEERNTQGELDFWGGDLDSMRSKLDYLQDLGIDVLYLNPIFHGFTNHKYDTLDYFCVDPQYGTNEELRALAQDLHSRGMRLILDGVFNHMGRRAPLFQAAESDPSAPEREYFDFHKDYRAGYLSWRNAANLPELKLEHPGVQRMVYKGRDSAVQKYLREYNIDGWRLDVAPDIGPQYLRELTDAAHAIRPDSVVIGECWNYPEEWLRVLDGILNMHARELIFEYLQGGLSPFATGQALERLIGEGGIEGILRSHLVLDNHDTPRLKHLLADPRQRFLARVLQFTLPGCPVVYYGSELGMDGGHDPQNRAPMDWDLLEGENKELEEVRRLVCLREHNPALIAGDFRKLDSTKFVAFLRQTGNPRETVIVVINASNQDKRDVIPVRDSLLMDAQKLVCLHSQKTEEMHSGCLKLSLPAMSARIFRTSDQGATRAYTAFKRVF